MKKLILIVFAALIVASSFAQESTPAPDGPNYIVKGGIGTSWIIMPKVFLVNPDTITNNAQILPATNGFAGYAGFQSVINLGGGWLFSPELSLSYTSGEVRVNRVIQGDTSSVQKLQSYVRAEVPLNFGVKSRDGFWVSFGPTVYFTLHDNKGFENAVSEALRQVNIIPRNELKSGAIVGMRFRVVAYAPIGERMFVDLKFESDLGQYFKFENDTYDMKFSLQNISVGVGYFLKKK